MAMAVAMMELVAAQSREHRHAMAVLSDMDYAYQLQMEEAMAASTGQEHDAWRLRAKQQQQQQQQECCDTEDARMAVALLGEDLDRCTQALVDKKAVEEENRAVAQNLQQRAHDLGFAKTIAEVSEDEWEEIGDTIERPFEPAAKDDDEPGTECEHHAFEIAIRGVKNLDGHLGVGCMLMDPAGKVVWEQTKYLGVGSSWHVAEYTGLLEAMAVAERLALRRLLVRVSSSIVRNQVKGFWKPKLLNQWKLMIQVREEMQKFSSFQVAPGGAASCLMAANELAHAAINNHLASHVSTSNAEAFTSGAIHKDSQEDAAMGASTSAGPPSRRRERLENCLICFEDKPSSEMATVKYCLHKFCVACMKQHAAVLVQASQVPVRCPQADCPKKLDVEECQQYLTKELQDTLRIRLKEATVPEQDRVYCPFANCSALMDKSGMDLPPEASSSADKDPSTANRKVKKQCIECRRNFCVECRVPWHWNRSCQEYQNLPPELRDAEDSNLYKLAQNEHWQRCKKCRRMIELAEGCYHMTCRCGHEFCYTCGAEWKNKTQSCTCKLWDERNIVRTPLNSDDEYDDDDDFDEEDEDLDEEMGEDFSDHEDEEGSFFDGVDDSDVDEDYLGSEEVMRVDPPAPPPNPTRNQFYKTKLCRYYLRTAGCTAGIRCNFAHGEHELRHV